VRFSLLVVGAALFSHAPLQCSRDPEPDVRTYETPPEALYALATRFKAKGEQSAYRGTLEYLVERYPNSRFAVSAKEELGAPGAAGSAVARP
jgi:outer membrane protein assembly factor BamD (BamD/ComL family)